MLNFRKESVGLGISKVGNNGINGRSNSGADPGFGQGGMAVSEPKSCRCSKVKQSKQCAARGPKSFFNAEIYILPHSIYYFSLIFDTYFNT